MGTARHVRPVPARLAAPPSALHRPTGTVDAPRSAAMLPASPRPKIKSDIETLFSTLFQVRPNPVLANARVFYKNDLMRVRKWRCVKRRFVVVTSTLPNTSATGEPASAAMPLDPASRVILSAVGRLMTLESTSAAGLSPRPATSPSYLHAPTDPCPLRKIDCCFPRANNRRGGGGERETETGMQMALLSEPGSSGNNAERVTGAHLAS